MRNIDMHDHDFTGSIPPEIADNLKEFFPEHDDLSYEEVLLQQESVYLYLQESGRNRATTSEYGHGSEQSRLSWKEGESSRGESTNSQLELDEALARSLQELGDDFEDFYLAEHPGAGAGSGGTEVSPIETPARAVSQTLMQDDVDPDYMSYEQLQSLGESIGIENKGMSEVLISQLPTFKYKSGMFSKKKKKEECVICCMVYSSGEKLINLPCAHQYHSDCIKRWLKLKKDSQIPLAMLYILVIAGGIVLYLIISFLMSSISKHCPICQTEVQDE